MKTCWFCLNYESMADHYDDPLEPVDEGRCLAYEDPDDDGEMWFSVYVEGPSDELRDMSSCPSFKSRI